MAEQGCYYSGTPSLPAWSGFNVGLTPYISLHSFCFKPLNNLSTSGMIDGGHTWGRTFFFFKKPEGAFCSNFTIRTNNNVIIREYLSDYFMWFTAVIQIFILLSGVGQHHSHMFAKYASNKTFPLSLVEVSVWFVPKLAELWSRHSLGHLQLLLILFLLDTEEDSCLSFNRNLYLTFNKPPFVNNNNKIIILK